MSYLLSKVFFNSPNDSFILIRFLCEQWTDSKVCFKSLNTANDHHTKYRKNAVNKNSIQSMLTDSSCVGKLYLGAENTLTTSGIRPRKTGGIFMPKFWWGVCEYKTRKRNKQAKLVVVFSSPLPMGLRSSLLAVLTLNNKEHDMTNVIKLSDINTTVNHEPRIKDLVLAEALGLANPYRIRESIRNNMKALLRFGEVSTRTVKTSKKGGRPSQEYFLNKRQALYICTKSSSANATEVTIQMVEVFDAVTSGKQIEMNLPAVVPEGHTIVKPYTRRLPGKKETTVQDILDLLNNAGNWKAKDIQSNADQAKNLILSFQNYTKSYVSFAESLAENLETHICDTKRAVNKRYL